MEHFRQSAFCFVSCCVPVRFALTSGEPNSIEQEEEEEKTNMCSRYGGAGKLEEEKEEDTDTDTDRSEDKKRRSRK